MKLERKGNNKGFTVVIGFILVFVIVIILFAAHQQVIVPNQDYDQEITHSRTLQDQLQTVEENIKAASNGQPHSTTLSLGLDYGGIQVTGVHSAPSSGVFKTSYYNISNSQISIKNAKGIGGTTEKYWNGTTRTYKTKYTVYYPDYNYYQNAPEMYYGESVLYSEYNQQKQVPHSDQDIIHGKTINIITLTGNTSKASTTDASLKTIPVSASRDSIILTNTDPTQPLTIEIPSRLNRTQWQTLLQNQRETNGGYVTGINQINTNGNEHTIQITLKTGVNYKVSLSNVYLSFQGTQSTTPDTTAQYVDWQGNDSIAVIKDKKVLIPATARDKYNNPVPGIPITAHTNSTLTNDCVGSYTSATQTCTGPNGRTFQQPGTKITDSNGQVTFIYKAPDDRNQGDEYNAKFSIYANKTK